MGNVHFFCCWWWYRWQWWGFYSKFMRIERKFLILMALVVIHSALCKHKMTSHGHCSSACFVTSQGIKSLSDVESDVLCAERNQFFIIFLFVVIFYFYLSLLKAPLVYSYSDLRLLCAITWTRDEKLSWEDFVLSEAIIHHWVDEWWRTFCWLILMLM